MNTCLVPGCGKTFRSERGLISHTEAVHGRDNVHRGMRAWERSRQQQGAVTVGEATEHNQEWDLEGEDFEYDFPEDEWVCCHCGKRSAQKRDILAHLKSGAHEVPRYYCADCPKKFKSMQALLSHFEMTGHSRPQQRLTSSLQVAREDLRSSQLLIGNGPPPPEGTLKFDGSPNGAGWVLYDHKGNEIATGGTPLRCKPLSISIILHLSAAFPQLHQQPSVRTWKMKRLLVQGDSELIIKQMNGEYAVSHANMKPLYDEARLIVQSCQSCTFQHVMRGFNTRADEVCRFHSESQ